MQFTKLFNSILDSTIWQEPLETKVVWITMLAMSDRNGELFTSIPGLAKRAGVSLGQCEAAITCLSSPDKYSRTKEHDGRRIKAIDGGFALLNHAKYRALLSAEERKEYNRRKQAEYRSQKNVNQCQTMSMTVNDNQQCQHIQKQRSDTDADAELKTSSFNNDNNGGNSIKNSFSMPSLEEFTEYYGKQMQFSDWGGHLPVEDWILQQHSFCAELWATKPPANWKAQTGRFIKLYHDYWTSKKPAQYDRDIGRPYPTPDEENNEDFDDRPF